ncbi:aminotransferase class I/II-fold pyridoxal phosphate-dependent enzyme [Vicingus serpentipes]|uniref:Aminotransferase class I/II-fold pyridoxal phosphate-dependent enzyme n=1 Tax=Vicingus serpentipes TaxID=1926625 RepID=A0A5C6RSU9_9FLAO|nr:methionine aminotransferase [Vicingus serpentipes]TXB64720.1 aminotransferase class I/II-fold pyridoxal phosphate-dependent enzyme [Vicingus serpentipes]
MTEYPSLIKSKLPKVGTTIFTVMSQLANETKAINLSQGFPDFESSDELINLVTQAMKKGLNQYAPMSGVLELREQISQKIENLHGAKYHPESEITITSGATQAIYTAIASTITEGDEVIIFTPAYDCYEPAIELNGGKTVFIQMHAPSYKIDWEDVKKMINQRTKMIIINTPHNPTATILKEKDMLALEKIVADTDIIVLSDEVYEHIVFDDKTHQSASKYPKLMERSFIVSSFGKTFHNTGWKIGYCVAPKNLMKEFRKAHQFIVFSVNTPMQYALAEYLKNENNYMSLNHFYQQKRDFFVDLIKGSKFEILPSKGTYFQLLNYKGISDEKDTDFAIRLTKEYGVASIPVSVFYQKNIDEKMLRFCFAKENETLLKAAEILNKVV